MSAAMPPRGTRRLRLLKIAAVWGLLLTIPARGLVVAQESAADPAPATPVPTTTDAAEAPPSLSTRQELLALRFQRFETTLLQLADYLRKTDPDRAELLIRALGKSKEARIHDQFSEVVGQLETGQLGDAIGGQESIAEQMRVLLTLLQSEDRQNELLAEQQRIAGLIRDVDKLISKQTDARALTERQGAGEPSSREQSKVAEQTRQLLDKIQKQDAEKAAKEGTAGKAGSPGESGKPNEAPSPGEPAPGDAPKSDSTKPPSEGAGQPTPDKPTPEKPTGDDMPEEGMPKKGMPKDPTQPGENPAKKPPMDESPPSEGGGKSSSPSDSQSPPSQSKPSPGKPSDSQPQEGQPPMGEDSPMEDGATPQDEQDASPSDRPKQTAGREELQQARKQMERAIEELKDKQAAAASDRQDQALAELQKAKEKLEEILRQLREEEQELLIAALEARFRDMLARQINVHNGTLGLAAIPEDQRTDRQRSRSIELARAQDEVALFAAKALTLLKEEGSSIAFPEAVVQIQNDMLTSARRLERVDVGELTQSIQKDVIESLEEILDSLQKEMEKAKNKPPPGQQPPGESGDPALVDAIAELKMLRSLQYRVNRRTKQLGRMVDGEQADDPDLLGQLRELSARQAKIQQTTDDLATGRNQ
jgi:hypothetical protein